MHPRSPRPAPLRPFAPSHLARLPHRRAFGTACLLAAVALTGCGGGGDGAAAPAASPEGIWQGRANGPAGAFDLLLVLPGDGSYWGVYSQGGFARGMLTGDGQVTGNAFASSTGREFAFGAQVPFPFTLASNFVPRQTFSGTATYGAPASGTATFQTTFDTSYDTPVSLASVAGTYRGSVGTLAGVSNVTITVAASGALTAVSADGCRVSGNLSPRGSTALMNLTLNLDAATCGRGLSATGIAGVSGGRTLVIAAATSGRTDAVYGTATRP